MKRLAYVLILFFLEISCGQNDPVPDHLIPRNQMELILKDMIEADILAGDIIKRDPAKKDTVENLKMQMKIFEHYKISRTTYESSYSYYCSHPELLQNILDSIQVKSERREAPVNNSNTRLKSYEKGI